MCSIGLRTVPEMLGSRCKQAKHADVGYQIFGEDKQSRSMQNAVVIVKSQMSAV